MDPLKLSALADVEDWSTFKPDMKGFISPQKMDLWPGCDDIQDQLRQFTSTDFMRDNNAPFLALSVSKEFPATRLVICEETFAVPVSSRDMAFLATHLGNRTGSRHAVLATKVSVLSDAARSLIWSTNHTVLENLKTMEGNGGHDIAFVGLDIFKAGSHCLQTTVNDEDHYATIFLVLPTFTDSVDICVRAMHDSVVNHVELPKDLSKTACAVGVYAGVSNAHIEVAFSISLARYRLARWVLLVECAKDFVKDYDGDDATLLCHLAPLAKAYGFRMYIARLTHTLSTEQEVDHPYKEYIEDEIDPSDLDMSDDADEDHEWEELRSLGGVPVSVVPQGLLELATKLVKTNEYLKDELSDLDVEEDHEILDESCYSATVSYTHTRSVSVLFIAP
ncbi:hypothetical protein B0H12DRAFT_1242327 [Mycena haematopus]|nr:hypothetical protein B0H12DRAFT_1242327 [Mycena haematopus]